jgi:hypothetical protein
MSGGYVDPRVEAMATSGRERALLAEIRARGLALHRLHADGPAIRVTGPGVWIMAGSLATLAFDDLRPADPAEVARRAAFYDQAERAPWTRRY